MKNTTFLFTYFETESLNLLHIPNFERFIDSFLFLQRLKKITLK